MSPAAPKGRAARSPGSEVRVPGGSSDRVLARGKDGRAIAAERLRRAIAQGEFAPGQRLVESDLLKLFDVTRGSLRAAIDELIADGLIERIHNRGARVRQVTLGQALEILECRQALECVIVQKAAGRASNDDIARLRANGELLSSAVEVGDLARYSELNQELHALIAEISGHETASGILAQLSAQVIRLQVRLALRPGWPKVTLGDHLAIIDAIAAGDAVIAEAVMREHLAHIIEGLQEVF